MSAERVDVLVIGGGVIGGSIAYHVARQGRRALVVERAEPAEEPAASWASAGGVRRQGRDPAEAALAREAIASWPTLADELGTDVGYRQGGQLLLAESDAEAEQVEAFVARQRAMGFADVRLVDRAEAQALVPGLSDRVVAGSYSPGDGQADPRRTTRAFAEAARRLGVTYWTGTECSALVADAGRVVGAHTTRGDVLAGATVLAAGVWSDDLALGVGLLLPMRAHALQMLLSTPAALGLLRPVIGAVSRPLSLKQRDDGAFLLGGGWLGDVTADRRSYTLRETSQQGNWATARDLLPALGALRIAAAWCGLEAISFDGIPFVGRAPGLDGLTLACGFSGHGFAIAPAVGRAVADLLAGRPVPELAGLDPARIAGFDAAAVAAFLAADIHGDYLD
jgi:sarcosine oxidase, subunit beta